MISTRLQKCICSIAVFEALKGGLGLGLGFGLLQLLHKDAHIVACDFISQLHLNPAHKFSKIFIYLADNLTDKKLWFFMAMSLVYSTFRFVEAYGLWKERTWAEWMAVISGTIYLPIEIYGICIRISMVRIFALLTNIFVVWIITYALIVKRRPLSERTSRVR